MHRHRAGTGHGRPASTLAPVGDLGAAGGYRLTPRIARVSVAPILLSIMLVAMLLPSAAGAHGPDSDDYRSVVDRIEPAGWPVSARIYGGDDELHVANVGDEELLVPGYDDEPYVRIGPDGVWVNHNSRAHFLNDERYGDVPIPDGVGEGPPKWVRVDTPAPAHSFHDHRIHWMARSLPPMVDPRDPAEQLVFEWEVPLLLGDEEGAIHGTLYYIGGRPPWREPFVIAAAITLALLLVTVPVVRRMRRGRRPS